MKRVVLGVGLVLALVPPATAQDVSTPRREITSDDFRLRMSAALALGRSGDVTVRPLLEQALADANPAVRTAAAAALGALGDPAAIPALEQAKTREQAEGVRAQVDATLTALRRTLTLQGVHLVLQLGTMRNATNVRGADLADVLRSATAARARSMTTVAVAGPTDASMLQRAASQHVPVALVDGTVARLTEISTGSTVTWQAEVEFVVRRVPDQALRSTVSGRAAAMGTGTISPSGVAALQEQAVSGAVESALRNADQGVLLAIR